MGQHHLDPNDIKKKLRKKIPPQTKLKMPFNSELIKVSKSSDKYKNLVHGQKTITLALKAVKRQAVKRQAVKRQATSCLKN